MKTKVLYCISAVITFLVFSLSGLAQHRKITGTVQEINKNSPLQRATVSVINNNISSVTDQQGKFELTVPAGKVVIQVSYTGYEVTEIPVGVGETSLQISLNPFTTSHLTDVVVVGYGNQKKTSLTSAVLT